MGPNILSENLEKELHYLLRENAKLDLFSGKNKYSGHLDSEIKKINFGSGVVISQQIISELNLQFNEVLKNFSRQELLLLNGQLLEFFSEYRMAEASPPKDDNEQENLQHEIYLLEENAKLLRQKFDLLKENEKILLQQISEFEKFSQNAINIDQLNSWVNISHKCALLELEHLTRSIDAHYNYLIEEDEVFETLLKNPAIVGTEREELIKQQEQIKEHMKMLQSKLQNCQRIQANCLAVNKPLDTINYAKDLKDLQNLEQELHMLTNDHEKKVQQHAEKHPSIKAKLQECKSKRAQKLEEVNDEFKEKKAFLHEELKGFESTQKDTADAIFKTGQMIEGILKTTNECLTSLSLEQKSKLLELSDKLQSVYANQIENAASPIEAQVLLAQCANEIKTFLQNPEVSALKNNNQLQPVIMGLASIEQNIQTGLLPVHLNLMNNAPVHREQPTAESLAQQQKLRAILQDLKEGKIAKPAPPKPPLPEKEEASTDKKTHDSVSMIEIDSDINGEVKELLELLGAIENDHKIASDTSLLEELITLKTALEDTLSQSQVNKGALQLLENRVEAAKGKYKNNKSLEDAEKKFITITLKIKRLFPILCGYRNQAQ